MVACFFCYFLYAALSFGIEQGTALRHLRQAGQALGLGEKTINQQAHYCIAQGSKYHVSDFWQIRQQEMMIRQKGLTYPVTGKYLPLIIF